MLIDAEGVQALSAGLVGSQLTLLWARSRHEDPGFAVELSGDGPLEATSDFPAALSFLGAAGDVSLRGGVEGHSAAGNGVQGLFQLAITVTVQAVAHGIAGAGLQWVDPGQGGEGSLGADPAVMGVGHQQDRSGDRSDPGHRGESGGHGFHDPRQCHAVGLQLGGAVDDLTCQAPGLGADGGLGQGVAGAIAPVADGVNLDV